MHHATHGRRHLLTGSGVLLLVATTAAPLATASAPAVVVRLKGVGRGRPKTADVAVIDANTGTVLADGSGPTNRPLKFTPTPGVAFADADVASATGARSGVSRVFRVGSRHPKRVVVPLHQASAGTRVGPDARFRPAAIPGSPVVTVGGLLVALPDGRSIDMGISLEVPLFQQTSDVLTWVDTGRTFLDARAHEIALQDSGATDPSTRITGTLLDPTLVIQGDLTTDGKTLTGEVRLIDPTTGDVLARFPVDGPVGELGDVRPLFKQLADALAPVLRSHATTTTTTTTSTTTSTTVTPSSTTTPTSPPVTTTTAPGGSTTTTLPGTCTSLSSLYPCWCGGTFGGRECTSDAQCTDLQVPCQDWFATHPRVTISVIGPPIVIIGWGSPVGILAERSNLGAYSLIQCDPGNFPDDSCPVYFDPGTMLELHAQEIVDGSYAPDLTPYCGIRFRGWGGAVQCTGLGDNVNASGNCPSSNCSCPAVIGTQDVEITATYSICDADEQQRLGCTVEPGCVLP